MIGYIKALKYVLRQYLIILSIERASGLLANLLMNFFCFVFIGDKPDIAVWRFKIGIPLSYFFFRDQVR